MPNSAVAIRFERGVHLPAIDLWLDPRDPRPAAFVSHAHSDHIGRHREIILTPATAKLMQARLPGERIEYVVPFGEAFAFRGARLTLLPAGHIAGSAQLHVTEEATGASLLYTGDFKLRPGLSAEPIEWRAADTLVMETTFGLPQYRFPPRDETIAHVVEFCRDALDEGAVAVLFGYSLGKGQEILCAIAAAGFPIMLHGAVHKMTEIYRELRPDFPAAERYVAANVAGHILICPPSASGSRMVQQIKPRRTAVLTGWAIDAGAAYRYGCDAAFPLSDHADYDDLVRYVELVQPRRVFTLHGFARPFAADLRSRGVEAWALGEEDQLEMSGVVTPIRRPRPAARPESAVGAESESPDDFRRLARLCFELAATPAKSRKIALLVEYLRTLDDASLPVAAQYLTGSAFPRSQSRVLKVGWSIVKRALLAVSKLGESELRAVSAARGDQAEAAREALRGRTEPAPFTLRESLSFFESVEAARAPLEKADLLQRRFAQLTPDECAVILKVLSGDLRIGLKEGLLEEAIAVAAGVGSDAVREANMLSGEVGRVAVLARRNALAEAGLTLFHPLKVMLASPESTAAAIWERHLEAGRGGGEVWIEDKFDGIRAQVHVGRGRTEVFSRDLRRVTAQFDEVAAAGRAFEREAIFDGEIVAFDADRPLTFFDLQKRLGRRSPDLFLGEMIPVVFVAFDLLALDGESLLRRPLHERRAALESISLPPVFRLVEVRRAAGGAAIDAAFRASRERQREGLIIKDPDSPYTPGRRGMAWLKLKMELATLDVVVVGAEWGHGKRHHVLSDYTFAVRDDASGALLPIGKAYSGLTDTEIAELTEEFLRSTIATRGKFHEVEPGVVLEIAFDSIQPSDRHASGLAMRFPRIKSVRRDKSPAEIDTLSYARSLSLTNALKDALPPGLGPTGGKTRRKSLRGK